MCVTPEILLTVFPLKSIGIRVDAHNRTKDGSFLERGKFYLHTSMHTYSTNIYTYIHYAYNLSLCEVICIK